MTSSLRNPLQAVLFLAAAAALPSESAAALRAPSATTEQIEKPHCNHTLLHPQACQNLSREECDATFHKKTIAHVQHQRQQQKEARDLQSLAINHNPRFGDIKVLVLLVQFSDHGNYNLIDKSVIESLWNGQIKDWFNTIAQGQYTVEPVVMDWMMTDNTEAFYADGQSGFTPDLKKAMYPILNQLDADGFDFSPFDGDGDGRLDSVVMLHSGISAVAGNEDCFGNIGSDRIWPHAFTSARRSDTWWNSAETVMLNGYTVNSVYDTTCDDVPMTSGLTCHEYMHTMDLIDLYDGTDLFSAKGVGHWDVMGHPYGADNSGTPGLLGAWNKKELGWLDPIKITADGDYVSKPAHDNLEAYMIDLTQPGAPAEEYLLIENRQAMGFEANIGGSGLLIWHIDDAADDMVNKGMPGQPGWPENGNHYRIAILPKDGRYDLENNVNLGDAEDLFMPGDILGPGGGSVYPNTDSYQSGYIAESGITLEVLTQEENGDITFRITGFGGGAEPAASNPEPTPQEPDPVDYTNAQVGPTPTEPPAPEPATPDEPAVTPQEPVPQEPVPSPQEPLPSPQEPVTIPDQPATQPQPPVEPQQPAEPVTDPVTADTVADTVASGGAFNEATQIFETNPNLLGSGARSLPTLVWSGSLVLAGALALF